MRYEIVQTRPYPTAEFEIRSKAGNIGRAVKVHKTKKWTDWSFEIEFQQNDYQMVFGKGEHPLITLLKLHPWTPPEKDPYRLYVNGVEAGMIFSRWGHRWLEINGCKYSTYSVGFGPAGQKCLVFEGWFDRRDRPGGKQVALIETLDLGKLLARYEVSAEGDMAGSVALLFGLYWDNRAVHQDVGYPKNLYLRSWGKALELYDPAFKDRIGD